jgi:hypothetical protein
MHVIGDRYATVRGLVDGHPHVIKLEDHAVHGRLPVRCHRELLGARLGAAAGVPVPPTRLVDDPAYGRLSAQLEVPGARRSSAGEQVALRTTRLGRRIALLDLAIDNRDRRPDNLLVRGLDVIAIDFNAAFGFHPHAGDDRATDEILGRWLGLAGLVALAAPDRATWVEAARDVGAAVAAEIDAALASVPPGFLTPPERARLRNRVHARATRLPALVDAWWRRTALPLLRFQPEEVLAHVACH